MKFLKQVGLVALGVAAYKFLPEQVDGAIDFISGFGKDTVVTIVGEVREFLTEIYNAAFGAVESTEVVGASTEAVSGTATSTQS